MIGRVERLIRALFGCVGIEVGAKRLSRCPECTSFVWDDEKRVRLHGAWFHKQCADSSPWFRNLG